MDLEKTVASIVMNPDVADQTYTDQYQERRKRNNETIKTQVIKDGRVDVLAHHVLGYEPQNIHLEMLQHQMRHQEGMVLAWRGSAKTTYCNVATCLTEMVRDSNIRICLASNGVDQSKKILREIKAHLDTNERFIEIFGDLFTDAKVWTETEITINTRTSFAGEPTVYCTGMGTALPSRHFDLIIVDDLVTKDNSQTDGQRKKTNDYFYQTLYPTLESPYGRLWVLGTRWHAEDLYGWFGENDYIDSTLIIPVLDEETDESRWPEKYPTARMHKIRKANLDAFTLQYMLTANDGASGGIFTTEHFRSYRDLPSGVFFWQGIDLAIGQKDRNDHFAHVTIAIHKTTKEIYLVSFALRKMTFPKQVNFIADKWNEYPATIRVIIEVNAYQLAMKQQMRADHPEVPVVGHFTIKDKVARAQQLAVYFTERPLHVKGVHHDFIRFLRGFPKRKGSKDLLDALEIAISKALKGTKKSRRKEPGLNR